MVDMNFLVHLEKSSLVSICYLTVVVVNGMQNISQHNFKLIQSCPLPPANNFNTRSSNSLLGCVRHCSRDEDCQSASFDETSKTCYMFSDSLNCTLGSETGLIHAMKVDLFYVNTETSTVEQTTPPQSNVPAQSTPITCLNYGTLNETTQTCSCHSGYVGTYCERLMKDCTEGFKSGYYNEHIFLICKIKPDLAPAPFQVMCYMKNHGGLTGVMKSSKWDEYLNRNLNWTKYRDGFGDELPQNHWIGLDKIHYITSSRPQHLYVSIVASTGGWKAAWRKYENFRVENESTNYRMTYSGTSPWSQNDASSDPDWNEPIENTPLGDSMVGLNGSAFSTYDRDNDQDTEINCAEDYQGGWWFNACADCNPNGPLKSPRTSNAVDELFWKNDYNDYESAKIDLMLRYEG